jgi:hypothetical protein
MQQLDLRVAGSCGSWIPYLTIPVPPLTRSLSWNGLGPEGGAALAEGLKGNTTLQSLEYAACGSNRLPSVRLSVSAR